MTATTKKRTCQHGTPAGLTCSECTALAARYERIARRATELAAMVREVEALEKPDWRDAISYKAEEAEGIAGWADSCRDFAERSGLGHKGWSR